MQKSYGIATAGFEEALERAHAYVDAGADMIFVESLNTRTQIEKLVSAIGDKAPMLHNLSRADDEVTDATMAEEIGYSVALFPGTAFHAVGAALDRAFSHLAESPHNVTASATQDRPGAKEYLNKFADKRA